MVHATAPAATNTFDADAAAAMIRYAAHGNTTNFPCYVAMLAAPSLFAIFDADYFAICHDAYATPRFTADSFSRALRHMLRLCCR